MSRAQEVLDAIDGALSDWTVSEDAMRWTPGERQRRADAVRHDAVRRHREQRTRSLVVPREHPIPFVAEALRTAEDMERARANLRAAMGVHPEVLEAFRDDLQRLGLYAQNVLDAIRPAAEQIGKSYAEVAEQWRRAIVEVGRRQEPSGRPGPAPTLRDTDPAAYALQARQTRSTGPNRQVQHEHRPRRTS